MKLTFIAKCLLMFQLKGTLKSQQHSHKGSKSLPINESNNITNKHNDLFTYLNYKIKRVVNKYNYTYIETDTIIKNNPDFLKNNQNYHLNHKGYNEFSKIIVEKIKNN